MHERFKSFILALFKVPPEPEAPAGLPESIRVFRASRNFYGLNLMIWALTQAGALAGIIAALAIEWEQQFPPDVAVVIRAFEYLGLAGWVLQLPITYFVVRLDFEMRWYIVTDRSLRIRHGIQSVREMTMTFANIQQITIHQGPIQRLLGISDLQVRTAGGGGADSGNSGGPGHRGGDSMHLGYFKGVDNPEAIRDLIVERLRRYRDAGLGDPDDAESAIPTTHESSGAGETLVQAAAQLAHEARELHVEMQTSKLAIRSESRL